MTAGVKNGKANTERYIWVMKDGQTVLTIGTDNFILIESLI